MSIYRNTFNGAERTTSETLGYPWIEVASSGGDPVDDQTEFAVKTADAILAEVGNDADLAQAALDEEQARETPRTVLSSKLQRIVDNASS